MRITSFLLLALLSHLSFAQGGSYLAQIDLKKASNDQLQITINTPNVSEDSIEYHMPKIVPGTYSISDFGRFLSSFKAYDSLGTELNTKQLDVNRWQIYGAQKLSKITYVIDDTFDENDRYVDNIIFEPGGTSIDTINNVYLLNTFGVIGYLKGYKFLPFEVEISHDESLYGATSLERTKTTPSQDTFSASNYNFLADGPIMYSKPDTAISMINGAEIIVSVYSPNRKLSAADVMNNIEDLMMAQTKYLGGKLPVERYAYLVYLMDYNSLSGGMGALEHSFSSVYTLPEANARRIGQIVRDVAAHEFLHIVTPLNIHSKEIGDFDYIEPKMSEHLWLYEGVTEYSAMHVQVRSKLYDEATFLDNILEKIAIADEFPEVSFTQMSKEILSPTYEPMYTNVYYKGALIGMCLDLYLTSLSNGTMDLPLLLQKLSAKYGPDVSFDDAQLINEITEMTYPEIGVFFKNHVVGSQPLPLEEVLKLAGYTYSAGKEIQKATLGNIALETNQEAEIVIGDISDQNAFGKEMGYLKGDKMVKINDQVVDLSNIQQVLDDYVANTADGDKVVVTVVRDVKGKQKEKKLKAKAILVAAKEQPGIQPFEILTEEEEKTREVWLNGLQ
ncbi:MAG: putative metalloprotease with PDZ domain [Cyclobacteriaceae bacterium]|jgi:predicted metalloprotease with PDZ domain